MLLLGLLGLLGLLNLKKRLKSLQVSLLVLLETTTTMIFCCFHRGDARGASLRVGAVFVVIFPPWTFEIRFSFFFLVCIDNSQYTKTAE